MLPTKFQANWLFGSEEAKNRLSRWRGSHLWFPIRTILAILDLQVTLMLPTKFQVSWPFGSGEEANNTFSRWPPCGHLGFLIRMLLAIFDLHVTLMLPTKFQVNWSFGSGEEVKNRFSRWLPWWPSLISDANDFSYFWSTCHPDASYQVSSQLAYWFRRRSKIIDFQDGCHSGQLGLPIQTILAIFDPQVNPMLPTKCQVSWPIGSGGEAKNRFSRWSPLRPSWISDQNDFSYVWCTSHPDASYQVSSQVAQGGRRSRLLKQLLTPDNKRRTLTDHNSSPWWGKLTRPLLHQFSNEK